MTDKATLSKYLRKVTGDLRDARQRIGELEQRSFEPIAIVGMSCRYPGGVDSPQALWRLLEAGGDGISRFPEDRGWPLERLFDPDPDRPGTSYVEESGFLRGVPEFDAEFFGISPREALTMDPQQRLLLEAAWEAIEDAGLDPTALAGSATGVFAGWMANAYANRVDSELEAYRGTGSSASVVSGRVAYALGLEGPAVTIDTACSSSLVAMHLAAQALRGGECELALAGGVTVMSEPARFAEFSRQRVLASDGRCKPFAAAADGIGWSEGVGLVLLERLSDAQRHGHPVLALIRGSATNQDGASNGLTAPNGPSQERVIRQALASAGLSAAEVDAIEAHGTGTSLGDPIEAQALLATYGQARPEGDPLLLGSIKSNLAHTQAAAGVAGVIKMVLALRAGVLPATIHLDEPTPHVDWSAGTIELLEQARPWQPREHPRRAGVSSFGVSGTNAHLIVEEAPAAEPDREEGEAAGESPAGTEDVPAPDAVPLLLAGKSEAALRGQAGRLAAHLRAEPELDPVDVGFSLASGRAALERRAAAVAAEPAELLEALDALAAGAPHAALVQGVAGGGKLAFVFPGHGSDWEGMALELLAGSAVFAERIAACEEALDPFLEFSLGDVLRGAEGSPSLERIDVLQPALFAVMIGLAGLWQAHGVRPAALVGHSQGEAAAAHVAGALSLEDAARIVARRSQAIESLKGLGEMMAIGLPAEETERRIESWPGRISLAVANSPSSSAVSGEREALLELAAACKAEGIRARQISDDRATHWDRVEQVRERLLDDLAPIRPRAAELPIYSSMSAGPVAGEELDAEFWFRSFRQPVRFEASIRTLLADGYGKFVEVSAHPVLTAAIEQTAEAAGGAQAVAAVGSLRRGEGGLDRFTRALAEAHCQGIAVDRESLFAGRGRRVPLPTYAFQRKRYWLEESSGAVEGAAGHPLLATASPLPGEDGEEQGWLFGGRLSLGAQPWLGDHAVHGVPILPGTGFVEMALSAGEQAGAPEIAELTIEAPLVLPEQGAVEVQVRVGAADAEGRRSIAVHSRPQGQDDELPWAANAGGVLAPAAADPIAGLGEWPPAGAEPLEVESLYERTAELGVDYGPAFQNVRAAWSRGEEVFAEVELGEEQAAEARRFGLHPALLDAALHPAVAADRPEQGEGPRAPFAWRGVRLAQTGAARLRVALLPAGKDALSLRIDDDAGLPVAAVESLAARPLGAAQLATAVRRDDSLFRLDWVERELPAAGGEEVRVERLAADPELDPPAAALQLCRQVLAALREAIADEDGERLAFFSHGAVATGGELPDPAVAAALGLVRSAQAEHPGRFLLVDADGSEASEAALAAALAQTEEPQLALREGRALAPRLARAGAPTGQAPALDPQRTVLITGGTGAIGSDFARHLVAEHGARQLLLTSRRGPEAPRAQELVRELEELGAQARVVACDVADRPQLQALLDSIPSEHPLGAVYHAAAIFDNALIEALGDEQLQRVLEAKAKSAWDLHELTAGADLAEFVLFSSGAGTFNHPGQGNYAAANAFLDALAQRRRAAGSVATSIAWGLWEREGVGPEERLRDVDLERVGRSGFAAMSPARGLELFERARADGSPFLVAADLDTAALRALARSGDLDPIHSGIVRVPGRRAADTGALARRLAEAPEAEREGIAIALVAEHVAAVLGHESGADIDPNAAFKDLGFDSLGAVELRNRLSQASGLRLPSTLVFDHPTTTAAAAFVRAQAEGSRPAAAPAARPATARSEEPVAIVGIGCRFPGGVESAADLWELVAAGRDAVTPFPDDRGWDLDGLYDPDPDHLGTTYAREGGFLDDAPGFDAEFFGISPREALAMDPQQRLLLEAAWEACEDAGLDPGSLAGTPTGVFTGVMHHDYGLSGGRPGPTGEGATSAGSFVSGRIAYSLGLEGPAITVDTACSSSLVAMHLAAQALRSGECDLALAGGVAVSATPGMLVMFSHQRGLAPDGRCKAFAAAADGTGVSEGVGLLVLERLSEARRNGHEVLAVLRGSATNQDGASNGITAPNGPSQERVIRQALANAGLAPAEVDAVEAHGTGTNLGDPIEAQALLATYGQEREQPLWLGSIKSNFGHAQAAAGVAAVIKMAMAMRHGVLPQTLHVDEPTAHVDWSAGAVELLSEARPWEANGHPRRAGVSSFGLSGTNAHVILEEAPAEDDVVLGEVPVGEPAGAGAIGTGGLPLLLPLSAKGEPALRAQAERLAAHLREHDELDAGDAGFTLATARATLDHRATAIAADREGLLEALDAFAAGSPHSGVVEGRAGAGKLAFLFSGQGAQRPGAGKELYERLPVFAAALDEICAELDQHLERPLKQLLFAAEESDEAPLLDRTEFTQPALFALEVALFRQLAAWGMTPDFLLGHSIGELAAAHVAGVFDLSGACKLVAARGALMGALPDGGAMAAIEASEEEVAAELPEGLSLAGVNSPGSIVVSGPEDSVLAFAEAWKQKDRKASRLRVSHAFHSALMEPMLDDLEAVAKGIELSAPQLTVISNLTGEPLTPEQATDPGYWSAQVRNAVRFGDGAAYLAAQGATTCIELGPDGVLCAMAGESFAEVGKEAAAVPALRKGRDEAEALLGAIATAHCNGSSPDWRVLCGQRRRVPLPTYAFQRRRYWLQPQAGEGDVAGAGLDSAEHPLLGAVTSIPGPVEGQEAWLLSGRLSLHSHPWLADHEVFGVPLLPGTAFVEMALKAGELAGAAAIEELTLEAPLVLPERGAVQVQVLVGAADEDGSRPLSIRSRPEGGDEPQWLTHAEGSLGSATAAGADLREWPPAGAEPLAVDSLYESLAALGIEYGPAFQGVRAAWSRGGELFVESELGEDQVADAAGFGLHPALLDTVFHPALIAADAGSGPKAPFAWRGVQLHAAGASRVRMALLPQGDESAALEIADANGEPLVSVASLVARELSPEALAEFRTGSEADALFTLEWAELPSANTNGAGAGVRLVELTPDPALDPPAAAQALAAQALAQVQEAVAGEDGGRIAFRTRGAVATAAGEPADPAAASAWGLVRSAQAEHPGRFLLVDADAGEASEAALGAALAQESEPQLALRGGTVLAPRLERPPAPAGEAEPLDPEKTVLVTGATGTLGALLARHLVAAHGARHLLLLSRRGPAAAAATGLAAEIEALGAAVRVVACDVADRPQLEAQLASVSAEHPLGAVFHVAGVLDDGIVESLDPERLQAVMAPKANGAWHLHELTREAQLSHFVLFSSAAASFGSPGQANYAAANAFLDALAARRQAEGLPARTIAWGPWGAESAMSSGLSGADRARLERSGLRPLAAAEGLELLDRAAALPGPFAVAAALDRAGLRALARAGALPPLFAGLVRVPARRSAAGAEDGALARRLAETPEAEREEAAIAVVAEHVAAVLGHASADAVDRSMPFKDLGFDSLGAVELRNRLSAATGLRLPSTLVFDYPTAAAVGAHLCSLVDPAAVAGDEVEQTIERLRTLLDGLQGEQREQADGRLRGLLAEGYAGDADAGAVERIRAASAEEILAIVNEEIGEK